MNKKSPLAVVIPIYKDSFEPNEQFSYLHNIQILKNWPIYLLGPKELESYIFKLADKSKNCKTKIIENKYFGSIEQNTELMMSSFIYECFLDFEYILICHFDAIVFHDNLNFWLSKNFDLIGAPLFKEVDQKIVSVRRGMNGGLSLRKISAFINIIEKKNKGLIVLCLNSIKSGNVINFISYLYLYYYKHLYKSHRLEDTVWSEIYPKIFSEFNIADTKSAAEFAFDKYPRKTYELNNRVLPFGIHSWWKYDKEFCIELMIRANIHLPEGNINEK